MPATVEEIEIKFGTNADATARAVDSLKKRIDEVKKASGNPIGGGFEKVTEISSKMDILKDKLEGLIKKRDKMLESGGTPTGLADVSQQINNTAMQLEMLGEHVDDFTYSWSEQGRTFIETASKADILKGKMKDLKKEFYLKLETDSLTSGQAYGYAERYQRLREKYEKAMSAASGEQEKGGYTAQAMENVEALVASLSKEELILQRIAALKREIATGVTNDTIRDTSILSKTAQIQKLQEQLAKLRAESDSVDLKNAQKEIENTGKAASHSSSMFGKLGKTLKHLVVYRILRGIIAGIAREAKEGYQILVQYSNGIRSADAAQAAATANAYATALNQVKNSVAAAVAPIIQALLPAIQTVAGWFIAAANAVNQFLSAIQGKSTYTRATGVAIDYAGSLGGIEDSASGASKAVKELERTILSFDEINALNGNNAGGGGGGGAGGSGGVSASDMFEEAEIGEKFMQFKEWLDDMGIDLGEILSMAKDVGLAILGWKIAKDFISGIKSLPKNIKDAWDNASGLSKVLAGLALLTISFKWGKEYGESIAEGSAGIVDHVKGVMSMAAGAMGGAIIGSMFGPTGTIIGLTLGFAFSVLTIGISYQKKKQQLLDEEFYKTAFGADIKASLDESKAIIEKTAEIRMNIASITGDISSADLANIEMAKSLINDIFAIDKNDNLTAAQMDVIKEKISILNSLGLDGIELHFDEATGHVVETREAVEGVIDELLKQYKLEAMKESIVAAYKEQIDAERELDAAEKNLTKSMEGVKAASEELAVATDLYHAARKRVNDLEKEGKKGTEEWKLACEAATNAQNDFNIAQSNFANAQKNSADAHNEAEKALEDAAEACIEAHDKVAALENELYGYVNSANGARVATEDFGQKSAKTYDDIQREAMETAGAYKDLEADAKAHLAGAIKETGKYESESIKKIDSVRKSFGNLGSAINSVTGKVEDLNKSLRGLPGSANVRVNYSGQNTGQNFAEGGFPKAGSFFWAGENNVPELMGTIGGRTAVASGREITGITAAVNESSAREAMLLNMLIAAVNGLADSNSGGGGITTTELMGAMKRQNRRDGATTFAV